VLSMPTPYRTILSLPGALAFSATGWVARLPISMVGLGLVLLVSSSTGSYGLAGSVSAAYVIAGALFAPVQARVVDRHGQHRVLPVLAGLNAVAMGALIVAVRGGAPSPVPQLLAATTGAVGPLIGSYVRARWTHLLEGRGELHTAYALEALLDEVVFMVGPPLVTFLATGVSPVAGLVVAVAAGVLGTLLLAAQRATEPPAHPVRRGNRDKPRLGWAGLVPLVVACFGLGTLFGSADVVVVAVASEAGQRAAAGLLIAGWATGSMLAALVLGMLRPRSHPLTRLRLGATALAATTLPLPFIDHLGLLAVAVFLAGFATSPTLVAVTAVVERTVPPARLTEGMAWTSTGMSAGVAAGAALAGQVIDAAGGHAGFFVTVSAGILTAVVTAAGRRGRADQPVVLTTTSTEPGAPNAEALAGDQVPGVPLQVSRRRAETAVGSPAGEEPTPQR